MNDTQEVSVHLAQTKPYHQWKAPRQHRNSRNMRVCFLAKPIPVPEMGHLDEVQPKIESCFVDRAIYHRCGSGTKSPLQLQVPPESSRV